ncbi:protein kinase domain-containing protein [Lentzea sp. CA-135723]|uniref:serine/threonine-protein kinase n=1 Tax=Lentzea sp. CA-135723 TaxID=3239950 RepID=UPI003D8E33AE
MPTDSVLLADRYRLGEVLGTGGMAVVRRATDTLLARDVAIKLFSHPADARRFDSEIRTLAGLSHPGLIAIYDADLEAETPFVVLQLVEGRTVRDHIAKGPVPVDEARHLGAALADALAHVHNRGFIHRDIKPSNILLDDEDLPRLADFGLARVAGDAHITLTGQVVGTAAYLAPEQVRGAEVTAAADVYALGLVLLECLTGRREYEGAEIEAAVARLHRPPVIPDDLPFGLVRLLSLMTSLSPARRPTAQECAEALRAAEEPPTVVTEPATVITEPPTLVTEPVSRRPRGMTALAVSAVLLAAVSTGLLATDRSSPATSEAPAQAPVTSEANKTEQAVVPVADQSTVAPAASPEQAAPPAHAEPPAKVAPPAKAGSKGDSDKGKPDKDKPGEEHGGKGKG